MQGDPGFETHEKLKVFDPSAVIEEIKKIGK